MDDIILNKQQLETIDKGMEWKRTKYKQTFEIAGAAGTGKSTLVQYLIKKMKLKRDEVIYMTYTGKASLVLNRKGCNAKTIHSAIYYLDIVPKLDKNGNEIIKNNRVLTTLEFKKRPVLPESIKLIVVDEGSTVNEIISKDILSFNIPILVLGDLDQLDPVWGKSYFLRDPDSILTEIIRQKQGDPIILLSQMAKNGEYIRPGKYGDKCFVINKEQITDTLLLQSDIILCGKNITRNQMNRYIRENIFKRKSDKLYIGDKVICRRNDWSKSIIENKDVIYLINGLVGNVIDINFESYAARAKTMRIDFKPDFAVEDYFDDINIDLNYLFDENKDMSKYNTAYTKGCLFEWGNIITVHLAQGSQYENVLIYNEVMGSKASYNKWLYTAITRAETGLVLAL